MKKALLIDDECWLRVQARDASADGRFVLRCEHKFLRRFLSLGGRYVKMFAFANAA